MKFVVFLLGFALWNAHCQSTLRLKHANATAELDFHEKGTFAAEDIESKNSGAPDE